MSIQSRLSKYPVPDSVWEEYHLDQEINDCGVGLDMELVRQAIQMDGRSRSGADTGNEGTDRTGEPQLCAADETVACG